jgi:hypothetical protein
VGATAATAAAARSSVTCNSTLYPRNARPRRATQRADEQVGAP